MVSKHAQRDGWGALISRYGRRVSPSASRGEGRINVCGQAILHSGAVRKSDFRGAPLRKKYGGCFWRLTVFLKSKEIQTQNIFLDRNAVSVNSKLKSQSCLLMNYCSSFNKNLVLLLVVYKVYNWVVKMDCN